MTEPTEPAPLPGLTEPAETVGPLEQATSRTLQALARDELLEDRHAALMQLLVTLARQIDRAANSYKAKDYAVANLAGQFRDTALALPEPGGDDDAFGKLLDEFNRAGGELPAALRDASDTEPA